MSWRPWVFAALAPGSVFASLSQEPATWPPIPPGTWNIRNSSLPGFEGALVLQERMRVTSNHVEHQLRIRVTSEAGIRALKLTDLSGSVFGLEARTVYPDGKVLPYNPEKDALVKENQLGSKDTIKVSQFVVPGVTADCIVDVRWNHWVAFRSWSYQTYWAWIFRRSMPVLELRVEQPLKHPWSSNLNLGSQPLPRPLTETPGYNTYVFRDLPGWEEIPFHPSQDERFPRITYFPAPEMFYENVVRPSQFWSAFARDIDATLVERLITGPHFKAQSDYFSKDLPKESHALAIELLTRIQEKIQFTDQATEQEVEQFPKEAKEHPFRPEDLEECTKRAYAPSISIFYYLVKTLMKLEVPFKVAISSSRIHPIDMAALHLGYRFKYFVVLESPGKPPLWLDPSLRFAPPGLILPEYQGTPALLISPQQFESAQRSKGKENRPEGERPIVSVVHVPIQQGIYNQVMYRYALACKEEADRFEARIEYAGYPEYLHRLEFLPLSPSSQEKSLRESWNAISNQLVLERAAVRSVLDPRANLQVEVTGSIEEEGRNRRIAPFPGLSLPIRIPTNWPSTRQRPLQFPFPFLLRASSKIEVPRGWIATLPANIDFKNKIGQVHWEARPTPGEDSQKVEVACHVLLGVMGAPAADYEEVKAFFQSVQESLGRTIELRVNRN